MKNFSLLVAGLIASLANTTMANVVPLPKITTSVAYSSSGAYGKTKGKRDRSLKSRSNRQKAKAKRR